MQIFMQESTCIKYIEYLYFGSVDLRQRYDEAGGGESEDDERLVAKLFRRRGRGFASHF